MYIQPQEKIPLFFALRFFVFPFRPYFFIFSTIAPLSPFMPTTKKYMFFPSEKEMLESA